jgi:hypothetical protein
VSPAKYTRAGGTAVPAGATASTTHPPHRVLKRSRIPRPVKCCPGVKVMSNATVCVGETVVVTRRASHQSKQCARDVDTPRPRKYSAFPMGAKTCGAGVRASKLVRDVVSMLKIY